MIKYMLGLLLSVFAFSLYANELICLPIEAAVSALKNEYNEEPVFAARLENSQEIVTITANEITGSWTLLMIDRTGKLACPLLNGEDYKTFKKRGLKL